MPSLVSSLRRHLPRRTLALACTLPLAAQASLDHTVASFPAPAQPPTPAARPFHVLALWSTSVEGDHVDFARQAIAYLGAAAARDNFSFQATTDWNTLSPATFARYNVVLWLDDQPHTPAQRTAFEQYIAAGGAWLGFHIAAYNDEGTGWPWFTQFLGGAVFNSNSWPPLPATLTVDKPNHPVTRGLPSTFTAPANEWYIWKPDPRANPDVDVLLTLAPSNYPLGLKDVLLAGDLPVVWTNRRYRMLYMNMGHGDKIFTSPVQNLLIENSLLWLASRIPSSPDPAPAPPESR